jgi:DNA-binding MarR family transcriptional regulator
MPIPVTPGIGIVRLALWNHRIERVLALESGLAVQELHCILQLHLESPASASTVAALLGVRDTYLSRLLRKLERRELILRTQDPRDRRKECVRLTSRGTERAERAIHRASEIAEEVLSGLPEERRGQFLNCIGLITTRGTGGSPPEAATNERPIPSLLKKEST